MDDRGDFIDPTDVAAVNERIRAWTGEGESIHPVTIGRVVVDTDALDALADVVRAASGGGPVMMVVDRTPMTRGGDDLKALIERRLASTGPLTVRRLPDDERCPFHADIEWARQLADDMRQHAAVVSVGSGSITDVAKYARHLTAETQPAPAAAMISYPTAASVTAYTSALAVLTVDGVKRTLPARAPDAVICDLRTIADAPAAMTRAGFGDTLARSVAYGDWFLASQLGMDDGFSNVPARLLGRAEQAMIDRADGVGTGDPAAIRTVLDGLLLAGMAMSIMNQTAPVSGWEHVISHFLDLTAETDGRLPALHGEQVGVGTLVAARAYEQTWSTLALEPILEDADPAEIRKPIETLFSPYDRTGGLVAEIWRDLEHKLVRWNGAIADRRQFVARKKAGAYEEFMRTHVRPSHAVADALRRAGAPTSFLALTQPVPPSAARAAVTGSHFIRARFTLGDLLWHTHWLTDTTAAALIDDMVQPATPVQVRNRTIPRV